MQDYTPDQIGNVSVSPINTKTKGMFSLVLIQPQSGDHITILEPCDWSQGRSKVVEMIKAEIDPFDIRFVRRPNSSTLETEGLPLSHINEILWWTQQDQNALDEELRKSEEKQ